MVVVGGVVGGDINDWSPLLGPSENLIYIEIVSFKKVHLGSEKDIRYI